MAQRRGLEEGVAGRVWNAEKTQEQTPIKTFCQWPLGFNGADNPTPLLHYGLTSPVPALTPAHTHAHAHTHTHTHTRTEHPLLPSCTHIPGVKPGNTPGPRFTPNRAGVLALAACGVAAAPSSPLPAPPAAPAPGWAWHATLQ
eukprot:1156953-Pelagomonas_calceolata.AAC.4